MKLVIKILDILRWLWGVTVKAQGYNLLLSFTFILLNLGGCYMHMFTLENS